MNPIAIVWAFVGGAFAVVLSALAYDALAAWWEARKWASKYEKVLKR
ncbi:hypothetical protein [Palaeococcus ferrophilus]|nr:hypothetical protein [Palaeococcus ferrophilus]